MKEIIAKDKFTTSPNYFRKKVLEPQRRFGTLGLKKSSTVKVSLS